MCGGAAHTGTAQDRVRQVTQYLQDSWPVRSQKCLLYVEDMNLRCPIERACEELPPPDLQIKSIVGRTGAFLIPSNMTPPFTICTNDLQHLDPSSVLESFIALTTEVLLLPQAVVLK